MKEIARRQNESRPLKLQFAARILFNRAETGNYIVWGLCALSAFASFLSSNNPAWIVPLVIIVADLLALLFEKKMEKDILQAANLRSLFDRYVFGMPQTLSKEATDDLYEVAEDLALKYPKKHLTQTTHTGFDTPPGVKDWYNTNIDASTSTTPVFSLIKENKWWDKKMVRGKYAIYSVVGLIILTPVIVLGHNLSLGELLIIVAGVLGLLIRLVERIVTLYKYEKISVQLDGFVENFNSFDLEKGLDVLQNAIEKRRQLPVVHCNAIHTKLAKRLHEKYEAIHKNEFANL